MKIAIVGGTGKEGAGLAVRWAQAGVDVEIGSRDESKAARVSEEINRQHQGHPIAGKSNLDAARDAERLVVLTVPYSANKSTLNDIKPALPGKILVDVTVPLDPKNPRHVIMPPEGSATEEAVAFLGDGVKVVAALQNVSSGPLGELSPPIHCDILVCGADKDAKLETIGLLEKLGVKAYDAGDRAQGAGGGSGDRGR